MGAGHKGKTTQGPITQGPKSEITQGPCQARVKVQEILLCWTVSKLASVLPSLHSCLWVVPSLLPWDWPCDWIWPKRQQCGVHGCGACPGLLPLDTLRLAGEEPWLACWTPSDPRGRGEPC